VSRTWLGPRGRVADDAWRPPAGLSQGNRAAEQDAAAGSRAARTRPDGKLASVLLRAAPSGNHVYAYLHWREAGKASDSTVYLGEVFYPTRAANLVEAWSRARAKRVIR